MIVQLNAALVKIGHILVLTPALLAQLHDIADVLRRCDDAGLDKRLLRLLNLRRIGVVQRRVDLDGLCRRSSLRGRRRSERS